MYNLRKSKNESDFNIEHIIPEVLEIVEKMILDLIGEIILAKNYKEYNK